MRVGGRSLVRWGIHPEGTMRRKREWARKEFRQGCGMIGWACKGHSGGSVENRLEEGKTKEMFRRQTFQIWVVARGWRAGLN